MAQVSEAETQRLETLETLVVGTTLQHLNDAKRLKSVRPGKVCATVLVLAFAIL